MTELIVIILIISILVAMAVILLGKSETDTAYNSAAQQSVHLGTASAKAAYYGNRQNLPTGAALQTDLSDGEPGITFTVFDADTHSTDSKNVSYTRDWGDQATVCAKSHTGYYFCERTTYGQTRLQMNATTRARGDTQNRSRCVGLSEPSTRACLATANHPARENGEAVVGWNPSGLDDPGDGSTTSYLTEVLTDAPDFYCPFDDDTAPLPTDMDCAGAADGSSEWNGPAGSVTLEQPGAITTDPSSRSAYLNAVAQNSFSVPNTGVLTTSGSEWTAEVWLQKQGGTSTAVAVSVDNTISMRLAGASGLRFDWRRVNGAVRVMTTDTPDIAPPSPWVYFVAVWDQPDMKLYVNGALVKTETLGPTEYPADTGARTMRPGYVNGGWTGGTIIDGHVDEFAFYPSALSAARIAAHYAAAGY